MWLVAFTQSQSNLNGTPEQLVSNRRWTALTYLVLCVLWLAVIPRVLASEAHLVGRLNRSAQARRQPTSVGFIVPTAAASRVAAGASLARRRRTIGLAVCAVEAICGVLLVIVGVPLGFFAVVFAAVSAVSLVAATHQEASAEAAVGPGAWGSVCVAPGPARLVAARRATPAVAAHRVAAHGATPRSVPGPAARGSATVATRLGRGPVPVAWSVRPGTPGPSAHDRPPPATPPVARRARAGARPGTGLGGVVGARAGPGHHHRRPGRPHVAPSDRGRRPHHHRRRTPGPRSGRLPG